VLVGGRLAACERLQPVEQLDQPALLLKRVLEHRGALLGRRVGMPVQRRQRGLDGRQRGA
jgi:hypothetical protein